MGLPKLASDERFADVVSRYRNQDSLGRDHQRVDAHQASAADSLQAAGVPASPVLTVQDVFADEHLRARDFFEPVSHAVAGWRRQAHRGV